MFRQFLQGILLQREVEKWGKWVHYEVFKGMRSDSMLLCLLKGTNRGKFKMQERQRAVARAMSFSRRERMQSRSQVDGFALGGNTTTGSSTLPGGKEKFMGTRTGRWDFIAVGVVEIFF